MARGEEVRAHEGGHDEVAALTRAVDALADELEARLLTEKNFTADVAHELRTPMTALVSAAELLPEHEATDLVRGQVSRLRRLVEDLLEISRLDAGAVDVRLEERNLSDLVPGAEVGEAAVVLAEPRRVDRIVANLIANAERHAGRAARVRLDGVDLVIEDDGPGFPAELLRNGPTRFGAGQVGGSGLGLTIARRQSEAMGATLSLSNRAEGGARVVVRFVRAGESSA